MKSTNTTSSMIILIATILVVGISGEVLVSRSVCLEDPSMVRPACLEKQECDSGLTSLLSSGDYDSIQCNFTFLTEEMTYNDDYPNCTESTSERSKGLGLLLSVPIPDNNKHVLINNLSLETDNNVTVSLSWGIGSTCDGYVAMFLQATDFGAADDASYQMAAVMPLDVLYDGEAITGKALLWGEGSAIHKRRTHEGCAIGGFTSNFLEGTCRLGGVGVEPTDTGGLSDFVSSSLSNFNVVRSWIFIIAGLTWSQFMGQ